MGFPLAFCYDKRIVLLAVLQHLCYIYSYVLEDNIANEKGTFLQNFIYVRFVAFVNESSLSSSSPFPFKQTTSPPVDFSLCLRLVIQTNFQVSTLKLHTIQLINSIRGITSSMISNQTKPFLLPIRKLCHLGTIHIATLTKVIL